MKLLIKKSFTEGTKESSSLERKKRETINPSRKQFTIKRAITSKNEETIDPTLDLNTLIGLTNDIMVMAPERAMYKAFVTKGNNGMLVR